MVIFTLLAVISLAICVMAGAGTTMCVTLALGTMAAVGAQFVWSLMADRSNDAGTGD